LQPGALLAAELFRDTALKEPEEDRMRGVQVPGFGPEPLDFFQDLRAVPVVPVPFRILGISSRSHDELAPWRARETGSR
jgi:hypothetical protein